MYANFASIYDSLMQDIPYEKWVNYIKAIIEMEGANPQKVLDLGCGTGNVAIPMARMGYAVTALDLSPNMLAVAEQKARNAGLNIHWVNQDMREIDIPDDFDLVLSMCDSLNYLTEEADLQKVFGIVYKQLKENGLFIFDLNSYYKISYIFGNETYTLNDDEISYIWENNFDEATGICEMELTFFLREGQLYKRFKEIHQERGYKSDRVVADLEAAGFHQIRQYEELSFHVPTRETERIYFVARK